MHEDKAMVPFNTMRDLIYKNQKTLAMMMPKILNADRFIRVALNELMKTPKLTECAPATVIGALMQCAQFGLEPNSILGHAYLVPFRNGRMNRMECQLIPGYKGLLTLARRSGEISMIDAHEVYENDLFDFEYGTDPYLKHKPAKENRGKVMGYYAAARLKDGARQFTVLSVEDVAAHRDRFSKAKDSGPWKEHFDEMAKKTTLRRLCKYLPASIELQKAVMLDELGESDVTQHLGAFAVEHGAVVPAIEDATSTSNGVQQQADNEEMEAIQSQLKAAQTASADVDKEPADAPENGLDDATWALFIEYLDEDKERAKLKKTVKDKMAIGLLKDLKGDGRRHFALSMQDAAKKAGLPFQVWVKE